MPAEFNIALADTVIGVRAEYESTRRFCRDFISSASPDFRVEISEEDIRYERLMAAKEAETEGKQAVNYEDAYLETLAVCRKAAEILPAFDTILFHGSAISVEGEAFIFAAKSGTGKSTQARLWREYFGEAAVMINDDKPLLKISGNEVRVYGSPWNGKHQLGGNISAPLKAIAILERAEENRISPLDKRSALPMLCQQSYRPRKAESLAKTMELIDRLGTGVKLCKLGCNMEPEAVTTAYGVMSGKNECPPGQP